MIDSFFGVEHPVFFFLFLKWPVINCFGMIAYKYWMLWLSGTGEERSEADCWEPVGGEMSGFVPLNCPPIVTSVPFSVLGFVSEANTNNTNYTRLLLSEELCSGERRCSGWVLHQYALRIEWNSAWSLFGSVKERRVSQCPSISVCPFVTSLM